MNRRDFLLKTGPAAVAASVLSSSVAANGMPVASEDIKPSLSLEDGLLVRLYDKEAVIAAMDDKPVIILVYNSGEVSSVQKESLSVVMGENPDFIMPVFVLLSENISSAPELAGFDIVPGAMLVLKNGFMEARRTDAVSVDDMRFLFEAVLMNEGGQG